MKWQTSEIHTLIRAALREDSARSDVTTRLLIDPHWRAEAVIVANKAGVIAGLPLAAQFFQAVDRSIHFKSIVSDGARVRPKQHLALIKGRAQSILTAERPALNVLQHLSGIATFTHVQVQKLKGSHVRLYDTRKTLPGWRLLQKYAVRCGGGQNHRMSLGDAVMAKENHLKIARLMKSDWAARLSRFRNEHKSVDMQIEVQTERDLKDVLRVKPQRVLLDNLRPKTLVRMMRTLRREIPGIEIEFTGGIKPENLLRLARLRPDRMSMGRLTHSVSAFDCSLDILRVYPH